VAVEGAVCAVDEAVGYLVQSRAQYDRLRRRPASGRAPAAACPKNATGPGRCIVRADEPSAAPADAQSRQDDNPVLRRIPITGARRRIFENMRRSLADTAQFSLHTEADASGVLRLRRQLKDRGLQISYNAMLIKIAAAALQKHRQINVSVGDGNQILVWERINIGLAMHIDDTLVVPVFRSPGALSLRQLNTQINACMRRIKRKRLTPDDLCGGTFTITNLGFADVDHFTPILRPPESAVLGIGRIVEKAVVCQGQVVARPQVGLSLTVDHRIIDGAPAARFLQTIKQMVENPPV
jgi:pyruvate/2-oxoglutarate dehydrogenase complex dihydrolipoamide acyltransferase (E2) component